MIRLTMKIDYDEAREELEGFMQGNAMASFVHLHFGSNPTVAPAFVERCRYPPHAPSVCMHVPKEALALCY
jgi:hypothetical protein